MSAWELAGGATGGALLLKGLDLGIAWIRARARTAEAPQTQPIRPSRSLSPTGIAAIVDQRRRDDEDLKARTEQTALLREIADGIEGLREDLSKTRHALKTDLQALMIEMASFDPGRGRMASRHDD